MIESLLIDVRDAVRGIRRNPLFACGVAGTIGVGLGFLCSAFTVINAYLLKPFEVRDPRALYQLTWTSTAGHQHLFTVDDIEGLRDGKDVFADVIGFTMLEIAYEEAPLWGQIVTGNYFSTLGIDPFLGRFIREEEAVTPGNRPVVVLSHDTWTARFGADPSVVGREIRLGRGLYTVIGVAQPQFTGLDNAPIGFWVPVTMAGDFATTNPYAPERPKSLVAVARLGDGVETDAATAWFDVWVRQRFSSANQDVRPVGVDLESRATRIPFTAETVTTFSTVLAAFALVTLIACANVANMMLARGVGRQREIAVRLSLGARRLRIVRQLLVESVLLAAPAALVALLLTWTTARLVPSLILRTWPEGLPPVQAILAPMEPDLRVSIFLVLGAFAAAALFGLLPAVQSSRTSLTRASRGEFGEHVRVSQLRNALVVLQVAASAMFLVTALAVLGSLRDLANAETGLDLAAVGDVRVRGEHRAAMLERLRADTRVEGISTAWRGPLYGALPTAQVTTAGSREVVPAGFTVVSPEYFDVFRLPLVRGRIFTREEAIARADVAVVSESTATRLWPGQDPLGQFIELPDVNRSTPGPRTLPHKRAEVIGIAKDAINGMLIGGTDPTCIYFPIAISGDADAMLLVRARSSMRELRQAVIDATATIREDASFPVYAISDLIAVQVWALGLLSSVVTLLAAIGLVLAVSGTYGVIAYLVMQRTREFGIRVALGATAPGIVRSVVQGALRLGIIGTIIGGALATALFVVATSVLEINPALRAMPFALGTVMVLAAMAAAAAIPSLRAARVDPATALRSE